MALEAIIAHKRRVVAGRKSSAPLEGLMHGLERSGRSLERALSRPRTGFVLECKKASPSRGLIRPDFDPVAIARAYAPLADAISVLTEERFFGGRPEYLRAVREATDVPVLCKDFVLEPYQVYEARGFGADAVLLMLCVLDDRTFLACSDAAASVGMDVLAEVHDENELERALKLGARIIGINNRNLSTLEVDLGVTERLAPRVPAGLVVVAESGVITHSDVQRLRPHVDGFLVGTSLMQSRDVGRACRELIHGSVKVCGLTRPGDAAAAWEAGAAYGGLIFAARSPRRIDAGSAAGICPAAPLDWVGVFVNENPRRVARLARTLALAAVQLHGEETREDLQEVRVLLPPGVEVWKAVRVRDRVVRQYAGADRILLDAFETGRHGGTGRSFDWSLLEGIDLDRVVLSGGLGPGNAGRADRVGASILDVNSGVEEAAGLKSRDLLHAFFSSLRGAGRRDR